MSKQLNINKAVLVLFQLLTSNFWRWDCLPAQSSGPIAGTFADTLPSQQTTNAGSLRTISEVDLRKPLENWSQCCTTQSRSFWKTKLLKIHLNHLKKFISSLAVWLRLLSVHGLAIPHPQTVLDLCLQHTKATLESKRLQLRPYNITTVYIYTRIPSIIYITTNCTNKATIYSKFKATIFIARASKRNVRTAWVKANTSEARTSKDQKIPTWSTPWNVPHVSLFEENPRILQVD